MLLLNIARTSSYLKKGNQIKNHEVHDSIFFSPLAFPYHNNYIGTIYQDPLRQVNQKEWKCEGCTDCIGGTHICPPTHWHLVCFLFPDTYALLPN